VLLFAAIVLFAVGHFGRPEIDTPTIMAMAISCAVLYFLSILLHELGHAMWARHERWKVDKITLYGFGGLAWVWPSGPYASARGYFRVIAAGPFVTVALILLFGAAEAAGEALGWPRSVVDVLGLLALGNLALLLFNLAPALPLDGGQMLLAWLWRRSSWGAEAANRTLRRTGTVCVYLTVGVGVVLLATGRLFAGYIVAVAGIEIFFMASSYYSGMMAAASARARPRRRRTEVVGDLIRERELDVPEGSSTNDFLDQVARARGLSTRAFAVKRAGELVGYTSIGLAHQAAEAQRDGSVAEAMVRMDEAIQLDPNTSLAAALEQLPGVNDHGIVVEDGRVTGIVSRRAIAEALLEPADAGRGRTALAAPR
jgi:Zn-dependent protease/sulfur carrier protein ThiS